MPQHTIEEAYRLAADNFDQGRLAEAESICRQILFHEQHQCETLGLLGLIAGLTGRDESAAGFLERAAMYGRPSSDLFLNLGESRRRLGQFKRAIAAFQKAIALKPTSPQAHNNLGVAYKESGDLTKASSTFRKAASLDANYTEALRNLGIVLFESGQVEEACDIFRRVLESRPKDSESYLDLGVISVAAGRREEAESSFREAILLSPRSVMAHYNLGHLLKHRGALDEAIAAYQLALELAPEAAEIHSSLGDAYMESGQADGAIVALHRAMELKSDFPEANSSLIFCLTHHPDSTPGSLARELQRWECRHASSCRDAETAHPGGSGGPRRLRIGYVSPDFREHSVARFLLPILENHDPGKFEVFCYSQVARADAVTDRCRAVSHQWRTVVGLSDEEAAALIRRDRIDILVDLAMHTANNRLLVFARKPAPVQVTYLAYAGSSGLGTMDYRLSDPYLDPPEMDESIYREKTVRLPHSYWCYRPPLSPAVHSLPALRGNHVTFGCLGNFSKVNTVVLSVWAELLHAVKGSRLLLHAPEGSSRVRTLEVFERGGVDPARVRFAGRLPLKDYLELHGDIDIGLDPFPYGGGTTTLDALWMGVPVVSLAGEMAVGRGGFSILSNLGIADLVARSTDEYVHIAASLAGNVDRLVDLRNTLRRQMEMSPLMDEARFVRDIESIYIRIWEARSVSAPPGTSSPIYERGDR